MPGIGEEHMKQTERHTFYKYKYILHHTLLVLVSFVVVVVVGGGSGGVVLLQFSAIKINSWRNPHTHAHILTHTHLQTLNLHDYKIVLELSACM